MRTGGRPSTIRLKSKAARIDERNAAEALKPGHALIVNSAGKLKKHDVVGGGGILLIAEEDALQGKTIDDAYAADDPVTHMVPLRGDEMLMRLAQGQEVSILDPLISDGAGCLIKSALAGASGSLYTSTAASAAVTNTVTETAFDKSYTIPANSLRVGDIIRVRLQAIPTSTNSTDTLNLRLKIGSTTIVATGAVDVANNDVGYIDATLVIRSIGASGTFVATGESALGVPGTVTGKPFLLGSTAIDTTAAQALTVTAQWSVASASNSVRLDILSVSIARGGAGSVGGGADVVLAYANEVVDNNPGTGDTFIKVLVA